MSHISVLAYSDLSPIGTLCELLYKDSRSAQEFMKIIQNVIGLYAKSINSLSFLSKDCSSQYLYSGIASNTNRDKS